MLLTDQVKMSAVSGIAGDTSTDKKDVRLFTAAYHHWIDIERAVIKTEKIPPLY